MLRLTCTHIRALRTSSGAFKSAAGHYHWTVSPSRMATGSSAALQSPCHPPQRASERAGSQEIWEENRSLYSCQNTEQGSFLKTSAVVHFVGRLAEEGGEGGSQVGTPLSPSVMEGRLLERHEAGLIPGSQTLAMPPTQGGVLCTPQVRILLT